MGTLLRWVVSGGLGACALLVVSSFAYALPNPFSGWTQPSAATVMVSQRPTLGHVGWLSSHLSNRHIQRNTPRQVGLATRRQALSQDAFIPSLPVLIVDMIPLVGNVIALSNGGGRLAWGIMGLSFSGVGALLMIPVLGIPIVAVALGVLQTVLFGLSLSNLILGLIEADKIRKRRQDTASDKDQPSYKRSGSLSIGGWTIRSEGWQVVATF